MNKTPDYIHHSDIIVFVARFRISFELVFECGSIAFQVGALSSQLTQTINFLINTTLHE